jgi:hypothetical protein
MRVVADGKFSEFWSSCKTCKIGFSPGSEAKRGGAKNHHFVFQIETSCNLLEFS